jgi:transposase
VAEAAGKNTTDLPVRVMFQDEARFGRINDPRRCWVPFPMRPLVASSLVREYVYAYAAVTPADGSLEWMVGSSMKTETMNVFLDQIARKYPREFIIMVFDGAPSHRSKDLELPANMALVRLPPYSPELNPAERLWDELREKEFANKLFDCLDAVIAQLALGLWRMEDSPEALQSLTGWKYILSAS